MTKSRKQTATDAAVRVAKKGTSAAEAKAIAKKALEGDQAISPGTRTGLKEHIARYIKTPGTNAAAVPATAKKVKK